MRIFLSILSCATALLLCTCNNIEDATSSSRNTFIKLYEARNSTVVTDVEVVSDGFVVLGNMTLEDDSKVTIVFKTDKQGNRISDYEEFPGGIGNSIKFFSNTALNGYIIIGDSIKTDPNSDIVANIDIASARIIVLDENLGLIGSRSLADTTVSDSNPYIADYYGESVTVTNDGRIILLGTYREGVVNQLQIPLKPFILALTSNLQRDWVRAYDLINRNYDNARSIHYLNDKIYWASGISRIQNDLTFSYVSIPVIKDESVFVNNSLIGEGSDQLFMPKDIHPAKNPALGFGVVGTYSLATDGSQGNIFFLTTTSEGDINPNSVKYFDAIESLNGESVASNVSQIIDNGEAIVSTSDGNFAIVGTFTSNPQLGKGLRDIILIKVSSSGNIIWQKTFGGFGDEDVAAIVETDDQGLLICGTTTIGTYSTPILIKTDKNGELKD